MTHDILQSDIDCAKRLIVANRPDQEVVLALARRGIESSKAAQVVDALRRGSAVEPEVQAPELGRVFIEVSAAEAPEPAEAEAESAAAGPLPQYHYHTRETSSLMRKRRLTRWVLLLLLAAGLLAVLIAVLHYRTRHRDALLPMAASTNRPAAQMPGVPADATNPPPGRSGR
jgi:hypothetical protein